MTTYHWHQDNLFTQPVLTLQLSCAQMHIHYSLSRQKNISRQHNEDIFLVNVCQRIN